MTLWSRDHRKTSAPPPISSSPRWKVRRRAGLSEPQIAARHRPALKRENCKGPAISHRGEEQSRQRGVASDRAAAVQPSISHRLSLLTVTTTDATITANIAWSLKGNSITNAKQERKYCLSRTLQTQFLKQDDGSRRNYALSFKTTNKL